MALTATVVGLIVMAVVVGVVGVGSFISEYVHSAVLFLYTVFILGTAVVAILYGVFMAVMMTARWIGTHVLELLGVIL